MEGIWNLEWWYLGIVMGIVGVKFCLGEEC